MSQWKPPQVKASADWKEFELPFAIGSGRSFFPDAKGEQALRMAFYRSQKNNALVGKIWFGKGIEGPPDHVHGGVSSYVLDEAMGSAGWLQSYPCVARKISFELLRMTPVGVDLNIEAWVRSIEGQTLYVESRIFDDQGDYTKGFGEFHWLDKGRMQKLLAKSSCELDLDTLKFPKPR